MKRTIIKKHDNFEEKFEFIDEEKWVYVHYSRDEYHKKAMFLKNDEQSIEHHLDDFFKENNVTFRMEHEIKKVLYKQKLNLETLLKASSLHLGIGIMFALSCIIGFKLGTHFDITYEKYPLFTLIGLFTGIGLASFTGYKMIKKYIMPDFKD